MLGRQFNCCLNMVSVLIASGEYARIAANVLGLMIKPAANYFGNKFHNNRPSRFMHAKNPLPRASNGFGSNRTSGQNVALIV